MEWPAESVLLETGRLVLRQFTMSNVDNLVALDADLEVMRFITEGLATSREEIMDRLLPGFMAWYRCPGSMAAGRPRSNPSTSRFNPKSGNIDTRQKDAPPS